MQCMYILLTRSILPDTLWKDVPMLVSLPPGNSGDFSAPFFPFLFSLKVKTK